MDRWRRCGYFDAEYQKPVPNVPQSTLCSDGVDTVTSPIKREVTGSNPVADFGLYSSVGERLRTVSIVPQSTLNKELQ